MPEPAAPSDPPKPRRRKRKVALGILAALAVLGVAVVIAVPWVVRSRAVAWLQANGHPEARVENVDVNLARGILHVEGLKGGFEKGDLLEAEALRVDLSLADLWQRRVLLESLELTGAAVHIYRHEAGGFRIGRVGLPMAEEPAEPEEPAETPWGFGIRDARLRDVTVTYVDPLVTLDVVVHELDVGALSTWAPDKATPTRLKATVQGAGIDIEGEMQPLGKARDFEATIAARDFPLHSLNGLVAAAGIYRLDGRLSTDARITGRLTEDPRELDARWEGTLTLAGLDLGHRAAQVTETGLDWQGAVTAAGPLGALRINANGALSSPAWQTALGPNRFAQDGMEWNGDVTVTLGEVVEALATGRLDAGSFAWNDPDAPGPRVTFDEGAVQAERLRITAGSPLEVAFTGRVNLAAPRLRRPDSVEDQLRFGGIDLSLAEFLMRSGEDAVRVTSGLYGEVTESRVTPGGALDALDLARVRFEEMRVDYDPERLAVTGGLNVDETRARLAAPALAIRSGGLEGRGGFRLLSEAEQPVEIDGNWEATDLAVEEPGANRLLGAADRIALREAAVGVPFDAVFAAAAVYSVRLLERPVDAPAADVLPHVAAAHGIYADDVAASAQRFHADSVRIDGLRAWLEREPEGGLEPVRLARLDGPAAAEPVAREAVETAPESRPEADANAGFTASIGRLELTGDSTVVVRDESIDPEAMLTLQPIELRVEGLDTAQPDQVAQVALDARIGEYTSLSASGTAAPLASPPRVDMQARVEGLVLPAFSGYTRRFIGYQIENGRLTLDATVKLSEGTIDASNDVLLERFELDRVAAEERTELTGELGMPLNQALNLLRDNDGDIRIDVPVTGDVTSPDIGLGDAIRQATVRATLNAVKLGVLAYLGPLGAAVAVGQAVFGNANVAFEPVVFEAGSSALTADAEDYLDKMADLLEKRGRLRINVAGVATPSDRQALAEQAAAEAAAVAEEDDAEAEIPVDGAGVAAGGVEAAPDAIPAEALLTLADARARNVKDALVSRGMDAERIYIAGSRIEPVGGDDTPRVEVGI